MSSLSYAENNATQEKNNTKMTLSENKLDKLLMIIRKAPSPLPKREKIKIEKRVINIYSTDSATINDINRRINFIEKQNKQREAKIKNFEEELRVYQEKIEDFSN
jgi:hypothetical protein